MYERVLVKIGGFWYGASLLGTILTGYIVRFDISGKVVACAEREVHRWLPQLKEAQ